MHSSRAPSCEGQRTAGLDMSTPTFSASSDPEVASGERNYTATSIYLSSNQVRESNPQCGSLYVRDGNQSSVSAPVTPSSEADFDLPIDERFDKQSLAELASKDHSQRFRAETERQRKPGGIFPSPFHGSNEPRDYAHVGMHQDTSHASHAHRTRVLSPSRTAEVETGSKPLTSPSTKALSGAKTSPTRQLKPLAVQKVSKRSLQTFDNLSPISSRSTSRRSSVSSQSGNDSKDLQSLAKNLSDAVSRRRAEGQVFTTQSAQLLSHELHSGHVAHQGEAMNADNTRASGLNPPHATSSDQTIHSGSSLKTPLSPAETSTSQNMSGPETVTIRKDYSSLRVPRPNVLVPSGSTVRTSRWVSNPEKPSEKAVSAPTSPDRSRLHDLTAKLNRDLPPKSPEPTVLQHTRQDSGLCSPDEEDQGCIMELDHEKEPETQSLPRSFSRKKGINLPEVPKILAKFNRDDAFAQEVGSPTSIDKFHLKAHLKPLRPKQKASLSEDEESFTERDEEMDIEQMKRRRKKNSASGHTFPEHQGGGLEGNGRSRSDPTQERKRVGADIIDNNGSMDADLFSSLRSDEPMLPPLMDSSEINISAESTLSLSSNATSISDATADAMYINVCKDVTKATDVIINASVENAEKNGKTMKKTKSLTWPNGDKTSNELSQYAQGIQESTSAPIVSERQEEVMKVREVARQNASGCDAQGRSQSEDILGDKESGKRLGLTATSPHHAKYQSGRGGANGKRHGSLSDPTSDVQAIKHERAASEPATMPLVPQNAPSAEKLPETFERTKSVGEQQKPAPRRRQPILPDQHFLRPQNLNMQMSESTPNLSKHKSPDSPSLSPGPKPGSCATLPRATADKKGGELSPASRRRQKQQDIKPHILSTFLETERFYVQSLDFLVKSYLQPLKSPDNAGLCDQASVEMMFYKIPEILHNHQVFLEQLEDRMKHWHSEQKIGDIINSSFAQQPILDTYSEFTNNFNKAKDLISKAATKPAFSKFLEERAKENKEKLNLNDLIIQPIQRIPRYELLLKELIENTPDDHPDQELLQNARSTVNTLAKAINASKNEADNAIIDRQIIQELAGLIDGMDDLIVPHRRFIRQYPISETKVSKKDHCLFLFSDLLICALVKRKSAVRRPSVTVLSPSTMPIEASKYKLNWKVLLDDVDIVKSTPTTKRASQERDLSRLEEDLSVLNNISSLADTLTYSHQNLDEVIKEITENVRKAISERQALSVVPSAPVNKVELSATTADGIEPLILYFNTPELRNSFESEFAEAKKKLAASSRDRFPPRFLYPIPIMKTRSGMQFSCAAPSLGTMSNSLKDVWVCNSDGYVGQVCLLSLTPEPTVAFCISVCSARILCIASVPACQETASHRRSLRISPVPKNSRAKRKSPVLPNITGPGFNSVQNTPVNRQASEIMAFDSEDSEEEGDVTSPALGQGSGELGPLMVEEKPMEDEGSSDEGEPAGRPSQSGEEIDDLEVNQPTMWLGTEDGCIYVYQCTDNIRTKKSRAKIRHPAAVQCILYVENRVFVSLANGDLTVYRRDSGHSWDTENPITVSLGSSTTPISKMVSVCGKLWCGCQNNILIVDPTTLNVEHKFPVCNDTQRAVYCMVSCGWGVFVSLQSSAVVRLFHATTYQSVSQVDVTQTVHKMLASSDAIIRQHKAACLRITALLVCKDLLWVGTSAGVVLTLPLPKITTSTSSLKDVPNPTGSAQGHTGHVRFLTSVDVPTTPSATPSATSRRISSHPEDVPEEQQSNGDGAPLDGRRGSSGSVLASNIMVISGGDGYEDFSTTVPNELAGKEDSTNHLLLWQV
ncbi:rho guanine nucleotide exchange factor 17-like [Diadema setosum]|uniref:rho guanine nucleotide exchange factor 17-like n=1 Tax=Diadema setosum TaxID=31175 RepID=UPI003B3A5666